MSTGEFDTPFNSPVMPELLGPDHRFRFNCYKGISCFNACCKQSDITLTPYDILRLKKHLGLSSTEFLKKYTVPATIDAQGMPVVKMRTMEDNPACVFLTEEGCSVYGDRPSACRYYPLGLLNIHRSNTITEEQHYCLVREEHCKGHEEDRELSIAEYRHEQGVEEYDENNLGWYQMILKKRSTGPAVGTPPKISFQFFFMASYDIDQFRKFVMSENFSRIYELDRDTYAQLEQDDTALLQFGYRLMRQVFFNEKTITEKKEAVDKRFEERKEVFELRKQAAIEEWKSKNDIYAINREELEEEPKKGT